MTRHAIAHTDPTQCGGECVPVDRMTVAQVRHKVAWEGGIAGALEWGLSAEMIEPGELRDAWAAVERSYTDETRWAVNEAMYPTGIEDPGMARGAAR